MFISKYILNYNTIEVYTAVFLIYIYHANFGVKSKDFNGNINATAQLSLVERKQLIAKFFSLIIGRSLYKVLKSQICKYAVTQLTSQYSVFINLYVFLFGSTEEFWRIR